MLDPSEPVGADVEKTRDTPTLKPVDAVLTSAFYWDRGEASRAWVQRYSDAFGGKKPTQVHAGVYSSILHYLKAVAAAGTKDATTVMEKMRAMPIDDPLFGKGEVRVDGRAVHDMYLFRV